VIAPFASASAHPYLHPGRSAEISIRINPNPKVPPHPIGYIGELHPQVAQNYHIETRVYVAVIFDIKNLEAPPHTKKRRFVPPSPYPTLERDLAFTLKVEIPAAAVESAIREKAGPLLKSLRLFDVYQGQQIEAGYKSMAYALRFGTNERTLTEEDVKKPLAAILENLDKLGAKLR
jgi:phenylalanyl-tRNA synthetase beta chain